MAKTNPQSVNVNVRVHPGSRLPRVEEREGVLHVYVREPAHEGRANEAVREALAGYFSIPKSACRLAKGRASKQKIFSIPA
jgi:uncharacterized protein